MKHKLMSACLILLLAFAMPLSAAAALDFDAVQLGSVTVTLLDPEDKAPIQGVELDMYLVASVTLGSGNRLSYVYLDGFEQCGVPLDDPELAAVLDGFVGEHNVLPLKVVTDANGTAFFDKVPLGLYFVKQSNSVAGYSACKSFLVTVPYENESGYVYDVNASPKTEIERLTDVVIKKVWNTDETVKIPDHVTVQLLHEDDVVETVTLNEKNSWKEVVSDLPVSDSYSILEVNVPKGFTATYTQKDWVFTVTNSASLVQTGQLVWPIPVLALVGLILIAVGTVLMRKVRNDND